jgi:hypothetical protein
MTGTVYVQACEVENIGTDGVCTVPVWIEQPQPVLPPLTLAEGTQVALAIIGCWTTGLVAGLYFKAANTRF